LLITPVTGFVAEDEVGNEGISDIGDDIRPPD
jgi:hypothetical protein